MGDTNPSDGQMACCTSSIGQPCAHKRMGYGQVIPRMTVLHGHTTQDTAHLTEDYPYGRSLRCQRKEWLEYKPKFGYRLVTQTSNPKRNDDWRNKPHAGQYSMWAVMLQDPNEGDTFGHISWTGLGINGPDPGDHVRLYASGVLDQLDLKETGLYRALLKISRKYDPPWERWRDTIRRMRDHILTGATYPTAEELTKAGHYIDQRDWEAALWYVLSDDVAEGKFDAWAPWLPVVILRDGKPVAFVKDEADTYRWFHRHHSYSLDHGVKYEGYEVKGIES